MSHGYVKAALGAPVAVEAACEPPFDIPAYLGAIVAYPVEKARPPAGLLCGGLFLLVLYGYGRQDE